MFFSVTTKNLNWEMLTKNLVTFKRWDGVNYRLKFQCLVIDFRVLIGPRGRRTITRLENVHR